MDQLKLFLMNNPFFSIVVICLNEEDTISNTISSVLIQSFKDYEIIVKDGLSNDSTLQKIPSDSRIKVFKQKDNGIYDAMNQAIHYCSGEYIFFLNCGDAFYNKDVLKNIHNRIPKDLVCCFYGDYYDSSTSKLVEQNYELCDYFWFRTTLCHQSVFFKKECFKKYLFDASYKIAADFVLMFHLYYSGVPFIHEPLAVSKYDRLGVSSTNKGRKTNKKEKRAFLRDKFSFKKRVTYMFKALLSKLTKNRKY